jgi:phenylacetate-CoA ligase
MIPRPHQLPTVLSLLRHPRAPRERIERFRDRKLRRLVRHAYARVPFYRELFDRNGVRPEEIRTAADLHRLPVISKRDFLGRPLEEILARGNDPASLVLRSTSGSSGVPFTIRRSPREEDLLRTLFLRIGYYYGFRPWLKHAKIVYPREGKRAEDKLRAFTRDTLERMNLFRLRPIDCRLPPEEIHAQLAEYQPDFVSGYSGTLARVARLNDPKNRAYRPRVVVTGSEVLTPSMRRDIEEGFGARVHDTYGSHEFTRIAYECTRGRNLHVCDDTVILEVLADGRPVAAGERGEVVVTALHSLTMPFIRYSLGDLVVRGEELCACGEPFSTIRDVQGRVVDLFSRCDGRPLHPYELAAAIGDAMDEPWIAEYQLVQEAPKSVVLRAVPRRSPSEEEVVRIEAASMRVLGPGMAFRCEFVSVIPLTAGGKFRTYLSLVDASRNGGQDGRSAARSTPVEIPVGA